MAYKNQSEKAYTFNLKDNPLFTTKALPIFEIFIKSPSTVIYSVTTVTINYLHPKYLNTT